MWPKTGFAQNQDSDQSISEDEDLSPDWRENCITLGGTAERKGGIQIQSQLELLTEHKRASSAGMHALDHGTGTTNSIKQRQRGFSCDDEVEVPVFQSDEDFEISSSPRMALTCNLDEDINSDDEEISLHSSGRKEQQGTCAWSSATEEAEALVHLLDNAGASSSIAVTSKDKNPCIGGQGKAKSKLLLHSHPSKEHAQLVRSKDEDSMSSKRYERKQSMFDDVPAELDTHGYTAHSMAELLDSFQGKNSSLQGQFKTNTGREDQRTLMVDGRNISRLLDRQMAEDDQPPEAVSSGTSSDDEISYQANVQDVGIIIPGSRQKTMADKFQEALSAGFANEKGPNFANHGTGIFEKLQLVMRGEKKREMDFLNRLHTGFSATEESGCIDVEILSRCLEAKLIVCQCCFSRDTQSLLRAESSQMMESRTLTIIFCPRACADVEIEIGNLIRVHSPWKEVQLRGRDKVVILSTCFSKISS
ncbi:hypothetical protein NMG60_11034953 [Bertholletia excelsa]